MVRLASLAVSACAALLLSACGGGVRQHVEDYPDRTPKQRGQLDGYKPIGTWQSYHADGTLLSEGVFVDGRQDGRWLYGHPGGQPAGVGHWSFSVQHGWWTRISPEGQVVSAGLMLNGRRHGPWLEAGSIREYGSAISKADGEVRWSDAGAEVIWSAKDAEVSVRAKWGGGPGMLWSETFNQPAVVAAFAEEEAPKAVAENTENNESLIDDKAIPAADLPASSAVEITPVPPAIVYGGFVRAFASSIESRLTGDIAESQRVAQKTNKDDIRKKLPNNGNAKAQLITGMSLPQTRFITGDGGVLDLSQPEKPTLLVIMRGFSGSVCLYCASQTAALADKIDVLEEAGLEVVVLYPGPASTVPIFLDSVKQLHDDPPPMKVALDVNQLLVSGLGIEGELSKPTTLLINTDGKVDWAYVGKDMKDRPTIADFILAGELAQQVNVAV